MQDVKRWKMKLFIDMSHIQLVNTIEMIDHFHK